MGRKKPYVNFTNILRAALTHVDPKSAKKTYDLTVLFVLLGSECVKAVRKMLMKLIPYLQLPLNPSE